MTSKMTDASDDLRTITSRELYALGMRELAYVKKVSENGADAYAVFAADGTQLGLMATRELAFAALKQHDLEPVSVH
ncbi:MAG TPA: DUF1150 family protein [Alphaproteobacteria bacterium]|nr:DUF1150 family protein [Alphaproteobacteria bacterium]